MPSSHFQYYLFVLIAFVSGQRFYRRVVPVYIYVPQVHARIFGFHVFHAALPSCIRLFWMIVTHGECLGIANLAQQPGWDAFSGS